MNDLLAKGAIDPSTAGAGFYSTVFLFLNILVACDPYLTLSSFITIGTYLLVRCLLSDKYSNLFNRVIM